MSAAPLAVAQPADSGRATAAQAAAGADPATPKAPPKATPEERPVPSVPQRPSRNACPAPTRPDENRCFAKVVESSPDTNAATGPTGLTPADIASAYKLGTGGGAGQTVAVVNAFDSPTAESDLGTFRSQFGLPACTTANGCFRKVNQRGGTTYPAMNVGWAGEIALDLDAVSSACPSCNILLVEADSALDSDLQVAVGRAVTLGASVISNSYGRTEASGDQNNTNYTRAGIPVVASTGDDGFGVQFPAASVGVIAAGGTTLVRNTATPRQWSESAWAGSGSGCSAFVPKPYWQKPFNSCARRSVADASAVADPSTGLSVYDTTGGSGWRVVGGTSLSSPLIAAMIARAGNPGSVTSSSLYTHAGRFFDVRGGSTGSGCSPNFACTSVGAYDGPTGLGSPNGLQAFGGGQANPIRNLTQCYDQQLGANDDGSAALFTLPFPVNFFGRTFTSLYPNNNGNVTFDSPLSVFTPFDLISTSRSVIAPLFADIDTRGPNSGLLSYGATATSGAGPGVFCANWVDTGYYGSHTDKLNSFQLLLIDRSTLPGGVSGDVDIYFNYESVNWETGDASGGTGGRGGRSARSGYSNGTSTALELPGSASNGAFLDGGPNALVSGSRNSSIPGQYIFPVRNGVAPTGGTIVGTVRTAGGAPIVAALIQVCDTTRSCHLSSTNGSGQYSVAGLAAGQYAVAANPPAGSSFNPVTSPTTTLATNATDTVNLVMTGPTPPPSGTTVGTGSTSGGIPVLNWHSTTPLTTHGCAGGTATFTVVTTDSSTGGHTTINGTLTESPPGSGTFTGGIPPLFPNHGVAQVTISIACPNPANNQTIPFDVYIDPSGVVVTSEGAPIAGATVTLLVADNVNGPFTPVPDGSAIMSPANRVNPYLTSATGTFGWDVVAGFYRVQASRTGCTTATTDALTIPPPVTDLRLVLTCAGAPTLTTQASSSNLLAAPVRDVATLTGGTAPTGTITFRLFSDAGCASSVFTSTTPVAGGTATSAYFTPASAGTYFWTASYSGDSNNLPTSAPCGAPNESVVIHPFSGPAPTRTLTGDVSDPITVNAGESLLVNNARVVGPITVNPGGALSMLNSSVTRGVFVNAPSFLSLCGAQISGLSPAAALSVTNAAVPVRVGDPANGCAGNRFAGTVTISSNLAVVFGANIVSGNAALDGNGPGNTVAKANNVYGTLTCANNGPAPTNAGQVNTAGSKTGQCLSL